MSSAVEESMEEETKPTSDTESNAEPEPAVKFEDAETDTEIEAEKVNKAKDDTPDIPETEEPTEPESEAASKDAENAADEAAPSVEDDDATEDEETAEEPGIRVVSLDSLHEPGGDEDETEDDDEEIPQITGKRLPVVIKPKANGRQLEGTPTTTSSDIVTRKRTASLTTSADGGPRAKLGRSTSNVSSTSTNNSGGSGELSIEDSTHDKYCWVCHKIGVQFRCRICPRSYHNKCVPDSPDMKGSAEDGTQCVCPECVVVMRAENTNYRSEAMKLLSMEQLMGMLKQICGRMKTTQGAEPFLKPVSPEDAEDYDEYVIYPMDIAKLEKNIKQRQYGSTEAFLSDAQWIVHNSIIFNSGNSPYTAAAKRLLKVAKQELSEIETCPECYSNAHHKNNWFVEACKRPHILVWAKLKGFPYWPAKAMKIKDDQADVRFFGQHDRAWVNVKDCYLYSLEQPNAAPKRSAPLNAAVEELNLHVEKLKALFGEVTFSEPKVVMGPTLSVEQIQRLLPQYVGNEPSKQRSSTQLAAKSSPGKSPMKMTISSLNTSPKVVSNSVNQPSPGSEENSDTETMEMEVDEDSPEAKPDEAKTAEPEDEKVESEEEAEKVKEPEGQDAPEKEVRVPTGILANALGLKRATRRSTSVKDDLKKADPEPAIRKSSRRPSIANSTPAKTVTKPEVVDKVVEDQDNQNDDSSALDESIEDSLPKAKHSKAQDFIDQAQTKPGYRFNISKDISISAIGDDMTSSVSPIPSNDSTLRRNSTKVSATGRPISLAMKPATFKNSPSPVPQTRPRLSNNISLKYTPGNANNKQAGQVQSQTSMQMQIQQMTHGLSGSANPRLRPTVVPSGATSGQRYCLNKDGSVRPMLKANRPSQQVGNNNRANSRGTTVPLGSVVRANMAAKDGTSAQTPSSVTSTIQGSQGHSGGAITLPGGTITVTPLTPLSIVGTTGALAIPTFTGAQRFLNGNSGSVLAKYSTGTTNSTRTLTGSTVSAVGVNGLSALTTKGGQGSVVRRTGNVTLPQSVANHMNQCAKGVNEILKNTVESIAFDILENGTVSGKIDATVAQQEKEALILKHSKEITDLRHNHDIAMRELRLSMEGEKRRAVVEMKRQCETEKQKILEEVKKKQWCARCSREAQFYCCWNTSYCGYHCQEDHWPSHMATCTQQK